MRKHIAGAGVLVAAAVTAAAALAQERVQAGVSPATYRPDWA
ncbi:MAG: hypothetical protein ACXWU0_08915 [Rhodoplanes sp.]